MFTIKSELTVTFFAIIGVIFILFSISTEVGAVTYDNDTSLEFTWTAASGDVDHYNVYVSIDEGEYDLVGTTSETSYTVTGSDGHTYKVKVEAVDVEGNVGPMSEESDSVICDLIEPATDVQATVSGDSILLKWTASTDAVSYKVYRDTEPDFTPDKTGGSNRIATGVNDEDPEATGVQWTDSSGGVVGDTASNYFYSVTTVNAAERESDPSNKAGEFDFELKTTPGRKYNWIALPLDSDITKASELCSAIGSGCAEVSKHNATMQGYSTYTPILPFTDFDLIPGYPYRVTMTEDATFSLAGKVLTSWPTFSLKTTPGRKYNWIALPLDSNITKASELCSAIGSGCAEVSKHNATMQGYSTYTPILPFTDFDLIPGYPYRVTMLEDVMWP